MDGGMGYGRGAFPSRWEGAKITSTRCYRIGKWRRHTEKKQQYFIDQFNTHGEIRNQNYLKFNIPWQEKQLIALPNTSCHGVRCEKGRLAQPKELWDEKTCQI
jgi:hypothetical protein